MSQGLCERVVCVCVIELVVTKLRVQCSGVVSDKVVCEELCERDYHYHYPTLD